MTALTRFEDFHVGEHALFERVFSSADFAAFSALSEDSNPLHHDQRYAREHSPFGTPIVPLHVTLAPLSMIAGMIFPGEPSLYLGHEVTASKPVKYGERLRYSARIIAINHSHRILTLRVLALRQTDVVLDATLRVQARMPEWESPPSPLIRKGVPGRALVTGASGELGGAIAVALARAGWRLLLQDRGSATGRQRLLERLDVAAADPRFVAADLATELAPVLEAVRATDDLELVVHVASPPVEAPVDALVAVNFSALKAIADAALPGLLARQQGAIVLLGTAAVRASLPGWEAYSGAKAMAMNLIDGIDRRCAGFGVRGYTLAPGYVATRFSAAYRSASEAALLPGEVAEALVTLVREPAPRGNTLFLEPGRASRGQLAFQPDAKPLPAGEAESAVTAVTAVTAVPSTEGPPTSEGVAQAIRSVLRAAATQELRGGGLGLTPGWDSLKHLEIILAIEARTGLHFKSTEIEATHRFDDLLALCARKLQKPSA
ncbi:MAG TPA: SDR family NAD(P)-dependent oxidoreductase [Polyangia bacterium]|jgi:NAD(P)-dependent dehydrogenase (short-subunit alcohol dehydrogenase family)/acyl dehydratase